MSELKPCPMTADEAISALEMCQSLMLFDPMTGETHELCEENKDNQDLYNACRLAIDALRRAQPANEPLTLEDGFDITNADGTPIDYDALGMKYKDQLCYCDIDGFYVGEDGGLVLMDDCGNAVSVDRSDYHIEVHKPGGEQE